MPENKPKQRKPGRPNNSYLRYSGLAFQMGATILLFVFLGKWLDNYFAAAPVFMVILSLVGVFAALYFGLKDFL